MPQPRNVRDPGTLDYEAAEGDSVDGTYEKDRMRDCRENNPGGWVAANDISGHQDYENRFGEYGDHSEFGEGCEPENVSRAASLF